MLGALRPIPNQFGESASASREAWRKAPGGSLTSAPDRSIWGAATDPMLSPSTKPRHAQGGGFAGEGAKRRWARPDAFEHDIKAALGLGQAHPRLALAAQKGAECLFQLGQARDDARRLDRADIDVDQLVRAGAAIAESPTLPRPSASAVRLRLPIGTGRTASISASRPRDRKAATTSSHFQAR